MNESLRTAATYETHADAYREKYRSDSVAARHGDEFHDLLDAVGLDGQVVAEGRWVSTLATPA